MTAGGAGSQSAWQQRRQANAARKAEEAAGTAVLQLRRCPPAERPAVTGPISAHHTTEDRGTHEKSSIGQLLAATPARMQLA